MSGLKVVMKTRRKVKGGLVKGTEGKLVYVRAEAKCEEAKRCHRKHSRKEI